MDLKPSRSMYGPAFSHRMPPVQNITMGWSFSSGASRSTAAGKSRKIIDADRQGVPERAELHFVIVTCVEQRHRPAFIEPALEFLGGELGRGAARRVDAFDTERDDLLLDPYEHAAERLVLRLAHLRLQAFEARPAAQFGE